MSPEDTENAMGPKSKEMQRASANCQNYNALLHPMYLFSPATLCISFPTTTKYRMLVKTQQLNSSYTRCFCWIYTLSLTSDLSQESFFVALSASLFLTGDNNRDTFLTVLLGTFVKNIKLIPWNLPQQDLVQYVWCEHLWRREC